MLPLCIYLSCSACYSFKGISIPPTVESYYIGNFQSRATNAPPELAQQFSVLLQNKVNNNTRLKYDNENPDIEFTGSLSRFQAEPVAPQNDGNLQAVAFNRLQIAFNIEFINHSDEKENWSQSFSFFSDYENDVNLSSVQDDLVEEIFEQITEDIFNKAFTNW